MNSSISRYETIRLGWDIAHNVNKHFTRTGRAGRTLLNCRYYVTETGSAWLRRLVTGSS
jgi:hypothetical protein